MRSARGRKRPRLDGGQELAEGGSAGSAAPTLPRRPPNNTDRISASERASLLNISQNLDFSPIAVDLYLTGIIVLAVFGFSGVMAK